MRLNRYHAFTVTDRLQVVNQGDGVTGGLPPGWPAGSCSGAGCAAGSQFASIRDHAHDRGGQGHFRSSWCSLKADGSDYRIRTGTCRVGLIIDGDTVTLSALSTGAKFTATSRNPEKDEDCQSAVAAGFAGELLIGKCPGPRRFHPGYWLSPLSSHFFYKK
jgi:hypothetical protein